MAASKSPVKPVAEFSTSTRYRRYARNTLLPLRGHGRISWRAVSGAVGATVMKAHELQVFTLSDGIDRGAPDPVPAMIKRYRPLV
jgi:hypothetical protein